jgi:NAD(P)-dependent dehydrogenase (short-subunit alcohol dehydrogenase family)
MTGPEERQVALVTGANRGIGREVARQLASRDIVTILSARDAGKAADAAATLADAGLPVMPAQLDVTDADSVQRMIGDVDSKYGRLDILINNAGIVADVGTTSATADLDLVQLTLDTNLFGAWRVAKACIPLMHRRRHGRIVNVSSSVGSFALMKGGAPGYRVSKAALNALTRMLAVEVAEDFPDILVNAVCPGDVRTDLGGPDAPRTVEEGADTPVWLATLPQGGPSGGFFRDREPIPW